MIANYHTHTPRCGHASGTEEEYVQAALAAGMEELGFSDHTPYWFPGGYCTYMRMHTYELADYCQSVRRVQQEYKDRLKIHLGLEVEYYPAYFRELISHLREHGIEYIILGQHWIGNELGEPYSGDITENEKNLSRYCDQVVEAMQTGLFTYLAHPDLIRYVGDRRIYDRHMRRICREAKQCGVPLEINLWGLHNGKHYPAEHFWELAAEEGNTVILGADAHAPWAVNNVPKIEQAKELAARYDLPLLQKAQLRKL